MPVQDERRVRLPPDARSPGRARRMLLGALDDEGLDELADTVVLLASELCENAVLHAGTEFEVELRVEPDEVVVTVSDRGAGPLELHLAQARPRYGRAATHGRGLLLLQRLATAWGTRHEKDGTHRTWFSLARGDAVARDDRPPLTATRTSGPARLPSERVRWLLHVPPELAGRLDAGELVAELARRLRELLDAEAVSVEVDEGDGAGPREVTRDGPEAGPDDGARLRVTDVRLPTTAPLRGRLRVARAPDRPGGPSGTVEDAEAADLTELAAQRIAMAVEAEWLRAVDQRRRAWLAYLAETSELLGQSLDVDLAVAVVPQVVVPRLGQWCAVHVVDDSGRLRLGALTHADEDRLPELREALEPAPPAELRARFGELVRGAPGPARFTVPSDGVALPLTARGRTIGTLAVGRPGGRPHTPEDVVLIADVARRAALAIHNAQSTAAHARVSQALQQALLPRALPDADGVEFGAEYVPASTGSDVGGDFYDVLTVDPAHWLVAIGDVCGTGAAAAARTGLVREVLRVLVRDRRPLPEAVQRLNDVMMEAGDPLQFCTLAAAMVARAPDGEPPGLTVELVLAGHLQPVLVRAGGRAELLGRFGTAVGLVRQLDLTCTRHVLEPGDALLVYTDGVTERRRGAEQFGTDRLLAAAAAAAGRPAAQIVGAVRAAVERFSDGPGDDDIALLAVRAAP